MKIEKQHQGFQIFWHVVCSSHIFDSKPKIGMVTYGAYISVLRMHQCFVAHSLLPDIHDVLESLDDV